MYAIELSSEFSKQAAALHPRRFKLVHLRIFALQANPRPPDCVLIDAQTCIVREGPYTIVYEVDDSRQVVRPLSIEENQ